MVGPVHCSGSKVRQNIMAEGYGEEAMLHSWQTGSRESKRVRGHKEDEHFQGMCPVTHLLQSHPTCLQLPPSQFIPTRMDLSGCSSHKLFISPLNIPALTQEFLRGTSYPNHNIRRILVNAIKQEKK